MKRPIIWSLVFTVWSIFSCGNLWAEAPAFPYIAQATTENVNVRAGQSENFERLCQLKLAEQVMVVEGAFGWLKINLPPEAPTYIHSQYILKINDTLGLVNADRVNVRARTNVESSVIGQLTKGDQVKIVKQDGEWFQIVPNENFYGWVKEDFLQFFSKNTAQFTAASNDAKANAAAADAPVKKNSAKVKSKENSVAVPEKAESTGAIVKAKGVLEPVSSKENLPYQYKISDNNVVLYYLTGIDRGIDDFVHYKVQIECLPVKNSSNPELPVCKVEKIQLVL